MKAISDVKFNKALQRIKEETVPNGYVEELVAISSKASIVHLCGFN